MLVFEREGEREGEERKSIYFPRETFIDMLDRGMVKLLMNGQWIDVKVIQKEGLKYGNDGAYYAEIEFVKSRKDILDGQVGQLRAPKPVFRYAFYNATVYNRKGGRKDKYETTVLNNAAPRSFYISFVYTLE